MLAFSAKDHGGDALENIAPTLRAGGHAGSHANAGVMPAVAYETGPSVYCRDVAGTMIGQHGKHSYDVEIIGTRSVARSVALRGRDGGATAELGDELATALRASTGGSDKAHVVTCTTGDYLEGRLLDSEEAGWSEWSGWRVRRLMPVECERLQGMPDNYTLVPYRGKPAADGRIAASARRRSVTHARATCSPSFLRSSPSWRSCRRSRNSSTSARPRRPRVAGCLPIPSTPARGTRRRGSRCCWSRRACGSRCCARASTHRVARTGSPQQQNVNRGEVYTDYGGQVEMTLPNILARGAGNIGMSVGADFRKSGQWFR